MTIYDISKKAGVSIATVSRVLNGSDKVHPSTRKRVMDIIEQSDYTPNAYARGMSLQSLQTVGILCADSSDLFLAKAIFYIEQELRSNGYESLLCCTGYNLDIRKNYLDLIVSRKVDAIILVGSNFIGTTEEENQYIRDVSAQIPIMLLNASFDHPNVYSIYCDDYTTMFQAAASMYDAGIHDLLYLYNSDSYSGIRKRRGFQAAMEARGVTDCEKRMRFFEGSLEQMNDIADFVGQIAAELAFHGILASEDALAIGGIKYAQRIGIRIPEELSVIGYNNSMLTTCCTPELSSVDNCLKSQTHQLVQTLIGVLSGEAMPVKSIFSGKLIRRGTTLF